MMKLIDLLKLHLTEWPEGVNYIAQDKQSVATGGIYGYDKKPRFLGVRLWTRQADCEVLTVLVKEVGLAEDYKTAVITKDDYTLATLNIGEVAKSNGVVDINALRDRIVVLDGILSSAKVERANIVTALKNEGLLFIGVPVVEVAEAIRGLDWRSLKVGDIIRITEDTDFLKAGAVVEVLEVEDASYNGSQPLCVRCNDERYWPDADVAADERVFGFELVRRA